ncbi:MAG: DUF1343 domain-containing protein [Syntrophorhabdaceae bacterium]|nr:DUF1343 domain-containing protein [Syntrophorhabdaceae bacterium]
MKTTSLYRKRGKKPVLSGLDVLAARRFAPVKKLSLGLICNPTAVDQKLRHAADLFAGTPGVRLSALFGPEHGIRGDAQYMKAVRNERDPKTGVKVHSLYGNSQTSLRPTEKMLRGLDALVFDIQDIGARYYTYQATMLFCMEAAAKANLAFFVLDRPNPINGIAVEGPALQPGYESFCGAHDIAARHGMTVGELALLYKEELELDLELTVIPCDRWKREMSWRDTGLPWVFPSPNMPTPETALVYPGMCLLEGTNLSEGRGTTRPFELFGAPWLNSDRLTEILQQEKLPGVIFRPIQFVPTWDKHAKTRCHGVEIHVRDPEAFLPFRTGIACIAAARSQSPARFRWRTEPYEFVSGTLAFDLLCGSSREREVIGRGGRWRTMRAAWTREERAFGKRRSRHLLY